MRLRTVLLVVVGVFAAVILLVVGTFVFRVGRDWIDNFRDHGPPGRIPTADLSGSGPGSLVSASTMPNLVSSLRSETRSARVEYRSTDGDNGAPTVVSGTVFTPKGTAPAGGWPVVSFGHGTTGIQQPCAPSLDNTLLGQAQVVDGLVKLGYAVAFADFQGLGAPGIHPYLDSRTAGYNVIDAVRALRATFPDVSNHWVGFGGSQGGGAVWSADEQAAAYAPDLQLMGTVALAPAADVSGLVDKSVQGTLTPDQAPAVQWVLASLGKVHPDFNLDDYRHGLAALNWAALSACSGPLVQTRGEIAPKLGPHDLSPATPAAADRFRDLLRAWALPQQPLSAPMLVAYGTDDTYIDPPWTTAAIARACALGGTLQWRLMPGKGHADVFDPSQLTWIADRFAGKPVTNECR